MKDEPREETKRSVHPVDFRSQNAFPVKCVRERKGERRAQPQHRIYLLRVTDTLLLRNKPRSCSNKKQSCYLPLLTDNKVKELCRLHGRQVALPRKVDTWSITLMADDISPRRPSASLVAHPGWRFFTGINLGGQSVAIHSATKDDRLCLSVHLSHRGQCYVKRQKAANSFNSFEDCPWTFYDLSNFKKIWNNNKKYPNTLHYSS